MFQIVAVKTRRLAKLFRGKGFDFQVLLFYSSTEWLVTEKVVNRTFDFNSPVSMRKGVQKCTNRGRIRTCKACWYCWNLKQTESSTARESCKSVLSLRRHQVVTKATEELLRSRKWFSLSSIKHHSNIKERISGKIIQFWLQGKMNYW